MSAVVLRCVLSVLFSPHAAPKSVGGRLVVIDRTGQEAAAVDETVIPDLTALRRSLGAAGSVAGHRLLRYLICGGVYTAGSTKSLDRRVVVVPGGLSGLAGELGLAGASAAARLREVLVAFKGIKIRLPVPRGSDPESLVHWWIVPEAPGQRSVLKVALHDALLPGFVSGLPKRTPSEREARRLVPIPPLLPPLVGHQRSAAGQALLQLHLMEQLSAHAEDLVRNGYVRIPRVRWESMARESGLRSDLLDLVLKEWLETDPPVLVQHSQNPELFTLGLHHEIELRTLQDRGQKSVAGRVRQALSGKARSRKGAK